MMKSGKGVFKICISAFSMFLLLSNCKQSQEEMSDIADGIEEDTKISFEANISIKELVETFGEGEVIPDTMVSSGFITAFGKEGNIQNLFLTDLNGGHMGIAIDHDSLGIVFDIGDEIIFKCGGFLLSRPNRIIKTADQSGLNWEEFKRITKKTEGSARIRPNYLSSDVIPGESNVAELVTIPGYQFAEAEIGQSFLTSGTSQVRYLTNQKQDSLALPIRATASFAKNQISTLRGNLTGIVLELDGNFVLVPRRQEDISFQTSRFAPFEKQTFQYEDNTLPYQIMFPGNYDRDLSYPLVIFLHGAGERGSDNEKQMAYGTETFGSYQARQDYPAIVVFPQCPSDVMWSRRNKYNNEQGDLIFEFPVENEPNYAMAMVIGLMNELIASEAVDQDRIFIAGLSMGGIGVFELFYYAPHLPAAGVSMAGGHDSSLVQQYAAGSNFWIFHGADDTVVPVRYSRQMAEALENAGANLSYSEAENRGHEWNYVLNNPDMIQWLFSQTR